MQRTAPNPRKADPLPYQEGFERPGGLRRPGEPSRIFNRKEAQAEYDATLQMQQEVLRKKNEAEGGVSAGAGGSPTGGSVFKGIDGRSARFGRETSSAQTRGGSFSEQERSSARNSALSGAFGSAAKAKAQADVAREENLKGRQGLFAEMKDFAAKGESGIDHQERAKALGLSDTDFQRGMARASGKEFAEPAAPKAAPLTGRALATNNIRTMGQAGATADYFKRAEAEKVALQQRRDSAPTRNFVNAAEKPIAEGSKSFASTFGTEVDNDEPSARLAEARKNAVAARTKADTMRAEYERGLAGTPPPTRAVAATSPAAPAPAIAAAPPKPAPTSLFQAIREDAGGVNRKVQNAGAAAGMAVAYGAQKTVEGAGALAQGGATTAAKGYLAAKQLEEAAKNKGKSLIPGRIGEYVRTQ